jgi:hypothetical protein
LVNFIGATLCYQQICVKKLFLRSSLRDVSVEILQEFVLNDAILVVGHHFGFISCLTIFPIKYEYFLKQSSFQNEKMLSR